MADYSDNFDRTNASTLGSNWTAVSGLVMPNIYSNQAAGPTGNGKPGAYWSANSFADNQYSELKATYTQAGGVLVPGPAVRILSSAKTYYSVELYCTDDGKGGVADVTLQIVKYVSGTRTVLDSVAGQSTGNIVLRLEVSGTTLTAKSGTTHGSLTTRKTATDSAIASGSAGLAFDYTLSANNVFADNWYGGDISNDVTVGLTGSAATSSKGSVGCGATLAIAGLAATLAAGTLAAGMSVGLTGSAATSGHGTVSPSGTTTVALTGFGATSASGSPAPSESLGLTGAAATGAFGSVSPPVGATVALAGLQAQSAGGSVNPGIFAIAAGGQVGVAMASSLSGQTTTASSGTPAPAMSTALSGQVATSARGSVAPSVPGIGYATGASVTAQAGTVTASGLTVAALTGASATADLGTVTPSTGAPITLTPAAGWKDSDRKRAWQRRSATTTWRP